MELVFEKWHGTGNDFIVVDDRAGLFPAQDLTGIRRLCDRHFGIGSDGLILIRESRLIGTDFHMEFFNPDGSKSFCGNGSRCAFAFWSGLQGRPGKARFTAIDGAHEGGWQGTDVAVSLLPVEQVDRGIDGPDIDFIHTGSPHLLVWTPDVEAVDILADAPPRRRSALIWKDGCNINYLQPWGDGLSMRTYERGVEAETLSCGSGVVAAALSALYRGMVTSPVIVRTRGGMLRVEAEHTNREDFDGIRLIGPAVRVFQGTFSI